VDIESSEHVARPEVVSLDLGQNGIRVVGSNDRGGGSTDGVARRKSPRS